MYRKKNPDLPVTTFKSSGPEVLSKKGVLINFAKLAEKHL